MPLPPGTVRDAVLDYLRSVQDDASLADIRAAVSAQIGPVPQSSVRSYLNQNVSRTFLRTGRGRYKLNWDAIRRG